MLNRPELNKCIWPAATKVGGVLSVARWSCRRWEGRLRERVAPGTSAGVVNSPGASCPPSTLRWRSVTLHHRTFPRIGPARGIPGTSTSNDCFREFLKSIL